MRVVVPALSETCEASRALGAEGVEFLLVEMEDEGHYGRLLADLWDAGHGFTIVEHDVVPWPGALRQLAACERGWCGYEYPLGKRGKLGGALGCVRFSTRLIEEHPALAASWRDCSWRELDGRVQADAGRAVGRDHYHVHRPPVAHARRAETWSS